MTSFVVTANPPTPNGDLHLGHMAGPFVAADVFARYQRLLGNRSFYVTSSDDHQSFVPTTAHRSGAGPAELADRFSKRIQRTLGAADIQVDLYARALEAPAHIALVQQFFRLLREREIVRPQRRPTYQCEHCDTLLFESFVKGTCPFCGHGANGNLCEACGRSYDPMLLDEPSCSRCGALPSVTDFEGLYLDLERYRPQLERFYESRTTWRPHLRALLDSLLGGKLPDYPVSYPSDWGIPVPLPGYEGQVINVWVEMYPGFIRLIRTLDAVEQAGVEKGLREGEATLVQFLGYDNSFCNALLHVCMSLAMGPMWPIPEHVMTNEFYLLDGRKFSTSQDHAIWAEEMIRDVGSDRLRYFVGRTNPEHWQTNFTLAEFAEADQRELNEIWRPAIDALFALSSGGNPRGAGEIDLLAQGLIGWARAGLERFYSLEEFSLRHASRVLLDFVEAAGEYAHGHREKAPLNENAPTDLSGTASALLHALSLFSAPLMPNFAERVWGGLGLRDDLWRRGWNDLKGHRQVDILGEPVDWFLSPSVPA